MLPTKRWQQVPHQVGPDVNDTSDNDVPNEDDPTVTIMIPFVVISDANETEGTDLVFDVNLSHAYTTDINVTIITTTGTAGTDDYTETNTTVTIPAGSTGTTVTVPSTPDTLDENDEQFTITASIPGSTDTGTGTIIDDDTVTVASITDSNVTEGTDENHTITMSGAASTDKDYPFTLTDNTTDGDTVDYTLPPTFTNGVTLAGGVLTVPAGVTTFDMIVPTIDDTLDEEEEFYDVTIGGVSAVGTITDNDVAGVTISDANATEGDDLVFDVNLQHQVQQILL